MNTFNRIVIVLQLLIFIVLITALGVMPHQILTEVGKWMQDWGYYFGSLSVGIRLAGGIFIALIFDAIAVFGLFLELRRKKKLYIRVQQISGGMATISTDSIIQQLQYKLDPIPGVIEVTPTINAKGDKVQAVVDVEVAAEASVPDMAAKLMAAVQSVLIDDLGLQVYKKPKVQIKVSSPSGRPAQPVQPQAPAAIPPLQPPESIRKQRSVYQTEPEEGVEQS
jgi:hypothetical protein